MIGKSRVRENRPSPEGEACRFSIDKDDVEIGHAFLYVLKNDLHDQPFGLLEDLFVEEQYRGQGSGKKLIGEVIKAAKEKGCYKLICTSRYGKDKVHQMYAKFNFKDVGKEFRLDF